MADDERNSDSSSSEKMYDSYVYRTNSLYGNNLNAFANDGSFLEMFKKKMEDEKKQQPSEEEHEPSGKSENPPEKSSSDRRKTTLLACVGKRRGGKVLPTGLVKKVRKDHEQDKKNDAWSQYMAEVKKYKDRSCEDEGKTRPLVK